VPSVIPSQYLASQNLAPNDLAGQLRTGTAHLVRPRAVAVAHIHDQIAKNVGEGGCAIRGLSGKAWNRGGMGGSHRWSPRIGSAPDVSTAMPEI
jgi:hypothetical protein